MFITLGLKRKNRRPHLSKGARKKGQCNNWTKMSHDQFKPFTCNHSDSESFGKDFVVSQFVFCKTM